MQHCHIRKQGLNKSIYQIAKIERCSDSWLYDLFNGVWDRKVSSGAPTLWRILTERGFNPFHFTKHGVPPEAHDIISKYVNQRRQVKQMRY